MTMYESQHTPTPYTYSRKNWRGEIVAHDWYISGDRHEDEDGGIVSTAVAIVQGNATSHPVCEDTAAFLCHAANCHHELLAVLENLVATMKQPVEESSGFDHPPEYRTAEDAALAEALFFARTAIGEAHERRT